ncbi:MAG TPA: hypothetical protein VKD91_01590, partial [Pyrinomonadaceae bacterium]|nr:hypothetical protein [Pyrinomonadaceae bacterium]
MKRFLGFLMVLCLLAAICVLGTAFSQGQSDSELANQHKIQHRLRDDKNEDKNKDAHPGDVGRAKPARNGISYHGGPVMLGTTHVYYIWYGNWSGNSATSILTNLAQNIGGSPYFNINTTYYDGSNQHVTNAVQYMSSTTDDYSH